MEIRLHYIEQGEGFPLILLHGNGEDHTYFKRAWKPFADHFRVNCCGYSWTWRESTGHWTVYTVPIRGGIEIVFRQHGISKCHLLGFSDGGNVALLFALKYPDRVERLILNGANLDPCGVKLKTQIPIVLGWGLCRLCALFMPTGKTKLGDAEFDGNPAAYTQGGAGGTGHAGSGSGGGTGYDPREPHSVNRGQYPKQPGLVILPGDHFIARQELAGLQ